MIIMKNMCEKPELFNPRHRTLVIMKDICEKLRLLNPRCKNILITEGVPTPDYGGIWSWVPWPVVI
jgi:hypothetical protein